MSIIFQHISLIRYKYSLSIFTLNITVTSPQRSGLEGDERITDNVLISSNRSHHRAVYLLSIYWVEILVTVQKF